MTLTRGIQSRCSSGKKLAADAIRNDLMPREFRATTDYFRWLSLGIPGDLSRRVSTTGFPPEKVLTVSCHTDYSFCNALRPMHAMSCANLLRGDRPTHRSPLPFAAPVTSPSHRPTRRPHGTIDPIREFYPTAQWEPVGMFSNRVCRFRIVLKFGSAKRKASWQKFPRRGKRS